MQAQKLSTEEFLSRFGDVIDDRVAEVLDEILAEILAEREALSPRRRLRPALAALALLFAVTASVVLRHSVLAVCMTWLGTAAACLAAACVTGRGRP